MKNLGYKPLITGSVIKIRPQAAMCPACNSEIGLTELIERKGYVGCVNCSK